MKHKKWIIAFLLISGLLFIFLYPVKPSINGTWVVERISVNNKDIFLLSKNNILLNNIRINASDLRMRIWQHEIIQAKIAMPDKHKLIIKSDTDTLINGKYEMTIDTIDSTEELTTRVRMKSKNKILEFSKTQVYQEPQWPKGISRGRP